MTEWRSIKDHPLPPGAPGKQIFIAWPSLFDKSRMDSGIASYRFGLASSGWHPEGWGIQQGCEIEWSVTHWAPLTPDPPPLPTSPIAPHDGGSV